MSDDISKYLPPWGQALLTFLIVTLSGLAAWRGLTEKKDRSAPEDPRLMPLWTMMGPVHEAIQTVHDMAENDRSQLETLRHINTTLMDMARVLDNIDRGQGHTHKLFEEMIRELDLRPPRAPAPLEHLRHK